MNAGWMRCRWCNRDMWREGAHYTEGGQGYCSDLCKHRWYRWRDRVRAVFA